MPFFPEDFIERVRESNDITEIIKDHVVLSNSGRNLKGICPFHTEKTPSFMVNPDRQIFKCFGCGVGGNVIHFVMKIQNVEFPKAVEYLAQRAGVPLPENHNKNNTRIQDSSEIQKIYEVNQLARQYYHNCLLRSNEGKAAREYMLKKRQIGEPVIIKYSLGYAGIAWDGFLNYAVNKGYKVGLLEKAGLIIRRQSGGTGYFDRFREQVIFPIEDVNGKVVGFGGRFMDQREPKYLNSPETPVFTKSRCIYGLTQAKEAIRKSGYAVLMEGYMDVLQAFQSGVTNAVATLGTALTKDHARVLRRFCPEMILMFDSDKAGLNAAQRGIEPLISCGLAVKVTSTPEGKDPDEYLKTHSYQEFMDILKTGKDPIEFAMDLAVQQYGIRSISGKMAVIYAMKNLIDKVVQPVERELYIKMIADRVQVDKQTVVRQYAIQSRPVTGEVTIRNTSMDILRYNENKLFKELIQYILLKPESIPAVQALFKECGIIPPVYGDIFTKLFAIEFPDHLKGFQQILDYFDDPEQIEIITDLTMLEDLVNPDEWWVGLQQKIRKEQIQHQIEILQQELKQAENHQQHEQVKQIQQ